MNILEHKFSFVKILLNFHSGRCTGDQIPGSLSMFMVSGSIWMGCLNSLS